MEYATWPCPLPGGGTAPEMALVLAGTGRHRVLVAPALLDEGPRMRRFTLEVMRRLAGAGIGCVLPDLPGTNESLAPLATQTLGDWRLAMVGAAQHFGVTHVLALRGGALVAPTLLPGWSFAPVTGASQLRGLLRARIIAAREAGREETNDALLAEGRKSGLALAGIELGAEFFSEFLGAVPPADAPHRLVTPELLGISATGLWLRAEPGEDAAGADALAAIVAMALGAGGMA